MHDILLEIKERIKNLKLMQRLFIVYVICSLVPLGIVYVFLYMGSRDAFLKQEYKNEAERIENSVDAIVRDMALVEELSAKFYFDSEKHALAIMRYGENMALLAGMKEFDSLMDYVEEYYPYVSDITVYLHDGVVDNRHFVYITDNIEEKQWFKNTKEANDEPYWSYMTNIQTGDKSLRLTRVLYNENHKRIGMIGISMDDSMLKEMLDRDDALAFIFYDTELLDSNFLINTSEAARLSKLVRPEEADTESINFRENKCMFVKAELTPRIGDSKYYIGVLKKYDIILDDVNKSSVRSMIPLVLAVFFSICAIHLMSKWFTKRIDDFRGVMHEAAKGDFSSKTHLDDKIHDEIWHLSMDLDQMIDDIEELMDTAVRERIQKEQIYSRQKDVEFKMLATQINPHFLYNTLENIRMLALINDQPDIADIAVNLTKLMRGNLNVGQDLKTIRWEMEMVESYIKIQNYRFKDRITAEVIYDKKTSDKYMIIPLVIQPFVENAYVHAMEDKEADGRITVKMLIGEKLYIYIEDNGHGMNSEKLDEITRYMNDFENLDRTHIGICNVNQRIKLKFGDEYGVAFESTENVGTKVSIVCPIIPKDQLYN